MLLACWRRRRSCGAPPAPAPPAPSRSQPSLPLPLRHSNRHFPCLFAIRIVNSSCLFAIPTVSPPKKRAESTGVNLRQNHAKSTRRERKNTAT
eukprot:117541-Rhodomonas_salina.1